MKKQHKQASTLLALGALGVVFGDIGTSPLYALQAIVSVGHIGLDAQDIYGVISLILWSITLVVSIKYLAFIMRANNNGEGGIMALVALSQTAKLSHKKRLILITIGFLGMGLFYGDSVITPAISVLSAVGGVSTIAPQLSQIVVPITLAIIFFLFLIQSRGTATIGKAFGPIMLVWFVVAGVAGLLQIIKHPEVLWSLSPFTALDFVVSNPVVGFICMGAVILAITGAEALYADMGHFGRAPITKAWFVIVFPALALNYMGQGALIVMQPEALSNTFFLLFPENLRLPMIFLATLATLIASQAVISGAFSLTRQAIQLGFSPRLLVTHTSRTEAGQVYISSINWLLFIFVAIIVVTFGSSAKLAGAYGMAVSMALIIDTILFLTVVRLVWKRPLWLVVALAIIFLSIDSIFFASGLSKFFHGGWLPISVGVIVFTILSTWTKARHIISQERIQMEGTLSNFVENLRHHPKSVTRLPGAAVYLGHHEGYAPLALHATISQLHELHEHVVVATIETANVPHIPEEKRIKIDNLGYEGDGISYLTVQFGFKDTPNVPLALSHVEGTNKELDFDFDQASYFISLSKPILRRNHRMAYWRKLLYQTLARNTTSATDYYRLPNDRTIEMTSYISL